MRPLRLEMTAFGPYKRTEVIDFRDLGANKVFLIHGETGAGKTSLLDAIVFALYGDSSGGERQASQMRCESADPATTTEVVFDFALGDRTFRIRRKPKQELASQRGSGLVTKQADAAMWERTGETDDAAEGKLLASKIRDVDAVVRDLLGFSCDQFRQVVILPQGKFRDLLAASSEKREEILRQLFRTERYAAVEQKLRERASDVRSRREKLRVERDVRLQAIGATDDGELAALTEEAARAAKDAARETKAADKAARDAGAALQAADVAETARRALEEAAAAELKAGEAANTAATAEQAAASALGDEEARAPERKTTAERVRKLGELKTQLVGWRVAEEACAKCEADLRTAEGELQDAREAAAAAKQLAEDAGTRAQAAVAAAGKLEVARSRLAQAIERAGKWERLGRATKSQESAAAETSRANERLEAAAAALLEADERCAHADAEWRAGRAAGLAVSLVEGEPCPVCGSTEHPHPAAAVSAVDDAQLDAARKLLDDARVAADAARQKLSAAQQAEATTRKEVELLTKDLAGAASDAESRELVASCGAECTELEEVALAVGDPAEYVADAREALEKAATSLAAAEKREKAAASALAGAAAHAETLAAAIPAEMRSPEAIESSLAAAAQALSVLEASLSAAQNASRDARERSVAASRDLVAATTTHAKAREATAAHPLAGDVGALRQAAEAAASHQREVLASQSAAESRVATLAQTRADIDALDESAAGVEAEYRVVGLLSDVANGQGGGAKVSFQRWVLGAYLDDVLASATRRLALMSKGRYQLERQRTAADMRRASGLDLAVFDEWSNRARPAVTLSGGESFLAALALALGLAETVQEHAGGTRLETIFVDEGFGGLDPDALDLAMDALLELKDSGRLVGVISHVPEMRDTIDARLEVKGGTAGSTTRFVVP